MTDLIFVGNPGTGKSTLLSCISGHLFESGLSYGAGKTKELRFQPKSESAKVRYGDTPGLADVALKKSAAVAIEKALKNSQMLKRETVICFVVVTEGGRVKPEDLNTIETVMGSVTVKGKKAGKNSYCVIVNKFSPRMFNDDNARQRVSNCFRLPSEGLNICTDIIMYMPKDNALEEESDARNLSDAVMCQELKNFLLGPENKCRQTVESVSEVKLQSADEYRARVSSLQKHLDHAAQRRLPPNPFDEILAGLQLLDVSVGPLRANVGPQGGLNLGGENGVTAGFELASASAAGFGVRAGVKYGADNKSVHLGPVSIPNPLGFLF